MKTASTKTIGKLLLALGLIAAGALLSQCSDSTAPPLPGNIAIKSGDKQWSLKGTELPEPLTVVVTTTDGAVAQNTTVRFLPIAGGGSVSSGSVQTNDQGVASVRLTLGPTVGTNRVQASIDEGSVLFEAMASDFLCPEADDSLQVCQACATSYGPQGHVFLATRESSLFASTSTGIVRINPFSAPPQALDQTEMPSNGGILTVVWDVAFSPRGDFYFAGRAIFPEILKIDPAGNVTHFAALDAVEADDAVEIDANPIGLLVGVDKKGPFAVGCRDTLTRFAAAAYTNGVNTDAVAVDPRRQSASQFGEDIYFILKTDAMLYRLALDSLSVETARGAAGLETVVQLTQEEADGARGMVCDGFDGMVYILVDTPTTKRIVRVASGGTKTTFYDFLVDPSPPLPSGGSQRDIALRRPFLYTLDTLNDKLLVVDLSGQFTPLFSDSLEQIKLSRPMAADERVGLAVLK
ncbi:MAG: hypothetical protein ACE5EO_08020 [Candidatus Krumholzibacteriia bacterium]